MSSPEKIILCRLENTLLHRFGMLEDSFWTQVPGHNYFICDRGCLDSECDEQQD
jgi:hypothetical protein